MLAEWSRPRSKGGLPGAGATLAYVRAFHLTTFITDELITILIFLEIEDNVGVTAA